MRWAAFSLALWLLPGAMAQDERRLSSPDGEIEFRIFIVGSQKETTLSRLAYQVSAHGRTLIDTSFMGLDVYEEEPILGENVGLTAATDRSTPRYHSLLLNYLQNGSTGRSLDVEVRVYDQGVAFRYIVPKSALLENIIIDEELTEFRIHGARALGRMPLPTVVPWASGAVTIAEVHKPHWAEMALIPNEDEPTTWVSTLGENRDQPQTGFSGVTPVVCPWRVIAPGDASRITADLSH